MTRFSVVIPTHNRPDLLCAAVASVAAQPRNDLQIIVSDNSSDPAALQAGCVLERRFADDPRIAFVRPPKSLPMPDHWEFATRHARGGYLLILTDRFVMRPGALDIVAALIDQSSPGDDTVFVWGADAGLAFDGTFHERPYSANTRVRDTQAVLAEFAACLGWRSTLLGSNALPRGLNSAVPRSVIDAIRTRYGRAYTAVSPDYTSAFLVLTESSRQIEIDMPLYAGHGSASNGAAAIRDGMANYARTVGVDPFEGCPLRIDTVINTTIRDYLWAARLTSAAMPPVDPVGYLLINWRELQLKREMGSSLDVAGMRRSILEASKALTPPQREAFVAGRAEIDARETLPFRARNLLARAGLIDPVKRLAAAAGLRLGSRSPRYRDVLEAMDAVPLRPVTRD